MNKTLTTALVVVAASLCLAAGCNKLNSAFKNIPGKVQGQCLDSSGGPRGYVSVRLQVVDTGEIKYQQNAEDSGNFFFDQVEPGKYKILTFASATEELPSDAPVVNVTPGKTVMKNVTVLNREAADPSAGG